jgi:hypothetical protein
MGGGLLQLVAYGAQDAYITGNPHITFWKVLYKRHTNFAIEPFRVNFTGAPNYGQRLVAVVNRNADLIWKTYVQVVLPDTFTGKTAPVYWSGDNQRRIGYLLLKKIEVEIGGQVIDTHYGEWLFLWECLTANFDTSVKLDSMVGGLYNGSYTTATSCGGRPAVLYIPLQFWFNRNPGLALPLIALQYHEVRFNITLGAATDLVSSTGYTNVSQAAAALPDIQDMAMYMDYVYLDVEERRRFAQESHEYLIDQLQTGIPQTINTGSGRLDLTLNHPVKELIWVFQDARKTDCGSAVTAAIGYTQPFTYDDIVFKARIQINGQDRFDERFGDYFWKVQPYQHHSGGAFWPIHNAVATTATLANGGAVQAAFTGVISGNVLTASAVTGTIAVNMLITGAGVPLGTYILGYGTGAGGAGTYELSIFVNVASTSMVGSLNNVQTQTTFNPINVYSFAISPEEHQPSGSCNFSRIDTATLVYESITSGGTGSFPSKSFPYNFRVYAVNYNIFRIMSGMGGLAYSN